MNLLVQLKKPLTSRRGLRFEAEGGSVSGLDRLLRVTLNCIPLSESQTSTGQSAHSHRASIDVDGLLFHVETRELVFRFSFKGRKD